MASKQKIAPPQDEGSDDQAWLTSYADLMTLVACFFILMMAFANYDPKGFKRKTKEVAEHFSGKALNEEKSKIEELVEEIAGHPDLKKLTKAGIVNDGLKVTFNSNQLFDSGKATLRPEVKEIIQIMISLIMEKDKGYRVIIEGHTDNLGVGKTSRFTNNWELSSARASSIAQEFENMDFNKSQIVALGYADARPLAPNQDNEGKNIYENLALNRRAVIKILSPMKGIKNKKLGLGVYFNEDEIIE